MHVTLHMAVRQLNAEANSHKSTEPGVGKAGKYFCVGKLPRNGTLVHLDKQIGRQIKINSLSRLLLKNDLQVVKESICCQCHMKEGESMCKTKLAVNIRQTVLHRQVQGRWRHQSFRGLHRGAHSLRRGVQKRGEF